MGTERIATERDEGGREKEEERNGGGGGTQHTGQSQISFY